MNQQPQHDMYYDFPAAANRSPGSTRQGYATVGMNSAIGSNRQTRGPFDPFSQYPSDDRIGGASGLDPLSRFDRMGAPSTIQSTYMLDNSQTWGYNGGVATMNGPMNGNGRLGARAVNRRAALPTVSILTRDSFIMRIWE